MVVVVVTSADGSPSVSGIDSSATGVVDIAVGVVVWAVVGVGSNTSGAEVVVGGAGGVEVDGAVGVVGVMAGTVVVETEGTTV